MANLVAPLSQYVLQNLVDKLYEKHKIAALEVSLHQMSHLIKSVTTLMATQLAAVGVSPHHCPLTLS